MNRQMEFNLNNKLQTECEKKKIFKTSKVTIGKNHDIPPPYSHHLN